MAKRKPIASRRDPEETKQRILDALARVILREGLAAVGINALAREAGCDKVLIYRYFADLDGLYAAFAASREFWWTVEEMVAGMGPGTSATAAMKQLLRRHTEALRARPVTLAVLAEEAANRTPLVIALEAIREERTLALGAWIARNLSFRGADIDFPAVSLIFSTATTYLAVRARKIRVMGGVEIKTDANWERIYAVMDSMIDAITRQTPG
jgi:AcrR family transcriptional regulator